MRARWEWLIASALLAGCGAGPPQQQAQPSTSAGAAQQVSVAAVESQKLNITLTLPAQILPYESVDAYPKVTGFIEQISVDRGSRVHSGELIIKLSAPELVAQRTQAEATLHTSEAQLAAARAKLASDRGTYAHLQAAAKTPGVVAGNDLQVAEQTVEADQGQVEAAAHNVQAARDALRGVSQLESYLEIRAPFDGVVTQRNLHPGALVGPASGQGGTQPIVRIESLGRLRVVVPVPEQYATGVKEGQAVKFAVPAYPGRTFEAPIARVSHAISQNTRTMQVELDVRNADGTITPGSFANVVWPVARTYSTLFVPTAAVTTDLQRTFVIRVREGKAEWVDVQTGATVIGKTEVFGDLQAGDRVVANATDAIRNGASVTAQAK